MERGVCAGLGLAAGWDVRRCVLAVEHANRESRSSWREVLARLGERGLHGVEFVVSDDHDGPRAPTAVCGRNA